MNTRTLLTSLGAALEKGRKSYKISDSGNQSSNVEGDKEGEENRKNILDFL